MENARKKRVKKTDINYDFKSIFPEQLRKLLENRNVTQEELAMHLGVARQSVSQWKDGKTMPNIYYLKKISAFFDVPYEYLLDGIQNENKENVNIGTELGLSDEAILILREYKENSDIFKRYEKEIDPSEGCEKYGDEFSQKYIQGSISVNRLKVLNLIIEEEQKRGIIRNMSNYVFGEFARKRTDPYPECASDYLKNLLDSNVAVSDKSTGRDMFISYELLINIFMMQVQKGLMGLREDERQE